MPWLVNNWKIVSLVTEIAFFQSTDVKVEG